MIDLKNSPMVIRISVTMFERVDQEVFVTLEHIDAVRKLAASDHNNAYDETETSLKDFRHDFLSRTPMH